MSLSEDYNKIASAIVKAQGNIIGPLAFDEAKKVHNLKVADSSSVVLLQNPDEALIELVKRYERIFGQASVDVCKDAVREIKPPVSFNDLPEILR